jgi:hypothetical protein
VANVTKLMLVRWRVSPDGGAHAAGAVVTPGPSALTQLD